MTAGLAWTHTVRDIPARGLAVERACNQTEAAQLAELLEIPEIKALQATYKIVAMPGGLYQLAGEIDVDLVQSCIISLDPVPGRIKGTLNVVFSPEEDAGQASIAGGDDDLEAPDNEPIRNGVMDIGQIIYEEVASQLNPYPRAEGTSLERSEAAPPTGDTHPFAALGRLLPGDEKS